jgi:hypothetical protein
VAFAAVAIGVADIAAELVLTWSMSKISPPSPRPPRGF